MLQLKFTNDVKVMLVDAEAARCPMVVTAYYWNSQRTFAKFSQSRRRKAPTRAFCFLKVHTSAFKFKNLWHNLCFVIVKTSRRFVVSSAYYCRTLCTGRGGMRVVMICHEDYLSYSANLGREHLYQNTHR